ncbi:MAG: hypothetical protein GFH27_549281n124 [Chloroflexi bacterium AL-W]|nr:hypothetical protein [Chloroflexi bacterium AL-N1]NOK66010.1 hypothetical protein [Chloroflexi bacterium AL-N10]NOK72891.1 hypothetical protein [Chloroflexi bacterium AL-N5]NOK79788.1 hypothetical protein [Chloroflexi bacterium AL-W]NOK88356.1 hypothetical protein [Chloroflexi bacterium AL-N15]
MTTHSSSEQYDEDFFLLSAYIDGTTTEAECTALEARLHREPALQQELDELRTTVSLLHDLPPVKPPCSFTLDPAMVQPKRWWLTTASWLQFGSALTAVMLALTVTFELVAQDQVNTGATETQQMVMPQDGAADNAPMELAEAPAAEEPLAGRDAVEGAAAEGSDEATEDSERSSVEESTASEPAIEESSEEGPLDEENAADTELQEAEVPVAPDIASSEQDDGANTIIEMPAEASAAEEEAPEEQLQQGADDNIFGQDMPMEPESDAITGAVPPETAARGEEDSAQRLQFGNTGAPANPLRIVQIVLAILAVALGVAAWRVTHQQRS